MTRRRVVSLLALAALGCARSAPGPAPSDPRHVEAPADAGSPFRFGWPVPARVIVTESVAKGGHLVKVRYAIVVRERPEAGLEVHYENYEVVELDGIDATTPEMRAALAPRIPLMAATPDLLLDAEGAAIDVVGFEELYERLLKGAMLGTKRDPDIERRVSDTMHAPGFMEMARAKVMDPWNAWVGLWIGVALRPGERLEDEADFPMPDGSTARMPVTFEHHGAAPGVPDHVRLSYTSVVEGDAMIAAMAGFFRGMLEGMPESMGLDPAEVARSVTLARKTFRVEIVTEPRTLRPAHVRIDSVIEMAMRGEPPESRRESTEYAFDWSTR